MKLFDSEAFSSVRLGNVFTELSKCSLGLNVLLVTSNSFTQRGISQQLVECLPNASVSVYDQVQPNPELNQIEQLKNRFVANVDSIVALGGGSVLDTAKVLSLWLNHPKQTFVELLNTTSESELRIPVIAIPTTSGTGAEVTPFATVWEANAGKKHSVSGVKPDTVILDATLTLSLAPQETLYSGLDALSHSVESIWNINQTPLSKEYAQHAIELICQHLPLALDNPADLDARQQLQIAACLAGLAISQTKTAIAHAISYPVTMQFGVPHGLACSFTLASIIKLYGHEKLNMSADLCNRVSQLLGALNLPKALRRYVEHDKLMAQLDIALDPSRAGNFVINAGDVNVVDILSGAEN